jgi:hypothetical protein
MTQETDDTVPAVPAGSTVARQCRQPEGVIEFAIGKQASVGGHPRSVELQLQAAVETGTKWVLSNSPSGFRIRAAFYPF